MPRARTAGRLLRIPVPPEIAYDLTFYYPPEKDKPLLEKHAARLREAKQDGLAGKLTEALQEKCKLTLKQRLMLLMWEFPGDLRLKVMKQQIENCSGSNKRWGAEFRRDPLAAYKAEADAVLRAEKELLAIAGDVQRLEEVLSADYKKVIPVENEG